MSKTITINGREFKLKEICYLDIVSQEEGNKRNWFKVMLKNSIIEPEPTDILLDNLTFKEGNELMKEINELNGISQDFQKPSKIEKEK